MICPNCGHKFTLTWSRYWQSLFGSHNCPSCQKQLKVVFSASYFLIICLLAIIIGGMPGIVFFFVTHSVFYGAALCVILAVVVLFPLDRLMADRHRPVKPID